MNKIIEVEIENKSYKKLLDIENGQKHTLILTTLEDNQSAVIIKIFLNTSKERILIKEFHIRNLKPKASGLPRFTLDSSYDRRKLNLVLKVDGQKVENSVIKMGVLIRNKLFPLFIILALLGAFIIFAGGKWLFSEFLFNEESSAVTQKAKLDETEILTEKPEPVITKKSEETSEIQRKETTLLTAYFLPNDTTIEEEAAVLLKDLVKKLKTLPEAELEISGYCAMTGTEEGRERLSRERAYKVLNFLKKEGWIPDTEPVIKWYGGERPVTLNEDEIYRNRRVEISIVSH